MNFSSIIFINIFLPLTLIACILARKNITIQNTLLLIASLLFYAWGDFSKVILLVISAILNFYLAKYRCQTIAILFNIGMLFVFKYLGFFVEILNSIFQLSFPVPAITLPIGISFFTFQAMSYVLDVCKHEETQAKSPLELLLYLALFPQLVAGPIVVWHEIKPQFTQRNITTNGVVQGLSRFTVGLSKKVLLADTLSPIVDIAFSTPSSAPLAWLGMLGFTLQIYLDFSGYTDMAIGIGEVLGFRFPENFRRPFAAASLQDFWRRWHMTLTSFFRKYIYLPLGGNRQHAIRNTLIVFSLTGIWHGANITFLIWGLLHGLMMILERYTLLCRLPSFFKRIGMIFVVSLSFVLFRANSLTDALQYYHALFTPSNLISPFIAQLTPINIFVLIASIMVSLVKIPKCFYTFNYILIPILFLLCYASIIASGYHPFIYFRF